VAQGWGMTVILGIHASPNLLPIHPMELFNGRSIIGSIFGGFKGKSHLPHFATQCGNGVRIIITTCNFLLYYAMNLDEQIVFFFYHVC